MPGFAFPHDNSHDEPGPINEEMLAYEERRARQTALLLAWFAPRMADDVWYFGLLLTTGMVLAISHIDRVHRAADGSVWLDVVMLTDRPFGVEGLLPTMTTITAPTSRCRASVNAAHVVWAFELADT